MSQSYEAEFNEALSRWRSGDTASAISLLGGLAERHPESGAIHGMLGGYLEDLGRHHDALPHLDACVRLSPRSELASITRFHALWALRRKAEAWAEARRFIALEPSSEYYDELFAELGERPG